MIRKKVISFLTLCIFSALIWLPLWMIISGSVMGSDEITECVGGVLNKEDGYARWNWIPVYPTLKPYVEILLDSPNFFVMFWNSCKEVIPGLIGQLLIGVPAAWSFARFQFRGRRTLFLLYIVLMIMPFQVTMVSSYLILDKCHLMNSYYALIVPSIFSTFPVFIMEKFFRSIPKALIEAAKIDGAGELSIFLHIGVPMGMAGIISTFILGFLEGWNALEQPLTFLKDKSLWPLSLYLPNITIEKASVSMVASVITMTPALLIFLYGQRYLEQGIVASGIKE